MAITAAELKYYKTTNNLGGAILGTEVTDATLENVFANITSAEAASGVVKYACLYIKNTNLSLTLTTVKQWIATQTASPTTSVKIGLGTAAVDATEQTIANELTAPAGVTFVTAVDEANHVAIADLANGSYKSFWLEWTVNAGSAAIAVDNAIVTTKGDTPA